MAQIRRLACNVSQAGFGRNGKGNQREPKRPAIVVFEAKICSVSDRLSPKLTIAQISTNPCRLLKCPVAVAPWKIEVGKGRLSCFSRLRPIWPPPLRLSALRPTMPYSAISARRIWTLAMPHMAWKPRQCLIPGQAHCGGPDLHKFFEYRDYETYQGTQPTRKRRWMLPCKRL